MASYVASKVGKHILKENAKNHFGTEDPYFDYVTPHDLNGNPGKVKKTKKAAPPGLTNAEAKILKKVTRRAYRLDNCFNICGIRVGWSAIFGIIPGLGDVFDIFMAMMVYRTICQAELPATLKSRMMMNIILDFAIGLVPILGDVADAVFRANTRNAALLYGHLRERGAARIKAGGEPSSVAAGSSGDHIVSPKQKPILSPTSQQQQKQQQYPQDQKHTLASPATNSVDHPLNYPGQTSGTVALDHSVEDHGLQSPQQAKVKDGSKGGWMSRFTGGGAAATGTGGTTTKKTQEPDLEAGERF